MEIKKSSSQKNRNLNKVIIILSIFAITISLIIKLFVLFNYQIGFDEAGISYIAEEMGSGKKIYIDFFDHKPPFMHYLLSFIFRLLEPTRFSIKILALIFDTALLITIFSISRKVFGKSCAMLSMAVYSFFNLFLEMNTETIMTIFGLLGFFFYFKAFEINRTSSIKVFLAGIFISISIWFKQSAVFFYIPIIFHLSFLLKRKKISRREAINSGILLTLGVLVISIPLLSYFLNTVGTGFLYSIIKFNLEFEGSTSRIFQMGKGLSILLNNFGFLIAISTSYFFVKNKNKKEEFYLVLLFVIAISIFIFLGKEIFYQHFFQLAPFLIFLSLYVFKSSNEEAKILILIIIFLGLFSISLTSTEEIVRTSLTGQNQRYDEILNYLNESVPKNSTFFSDNPVFTLLGGYNVDSKLVGVAPTFGSVFDYSFICNKEYLVLTHRQKYLSNEVMECVRNDFTLQKRFEDVGESFVEVLKHN